MTELTSTKTSHINATELENYKISKSNMNFRLIFVLNLLQICMSQNPYSWFNNYDYPRASEESMQYVPESVNTWNEGKYDGLK